MPKVDPFTGKRSNKEGAIPRHVFRYRNKHNFPNKPSVDPDYCDPNYEPPKKKRGNIILDKEK